MNKREPEVAKQYFHVDSDILDKREPEAAKQYFHVASDVLD